MSDKLLTETETRKGTLFTLYEVWFCGFRMLIAAGFGGGTSGPTTTNDCAVPNSTNRVPANAEAKSVESKTAAKIFLLLL